MAVTYTLVDDFGGKLYMDGNTLRLSSSFAGGTYNYSVRATDEKGWTKIYNGTFTVTENIPVGYINLSGKNSDNTRTNLTLKRSNGTYVSLFGKVV